MSEDLLWKGLQAINKGLDSSKQAFDDHVRGCRESNCQHFDNDALDIEFRVTNKLGPIYSQMYRNTKSKLSLFRDSHAADCNDFLRVIEQSLNNFRDNTDTRINEYNDLEFRVVKLKGVGWTAYDPVINILDSSTSYGRRTIQATLDRIQTGIKTVIHGHNVEVHIRAYKRGHLILDKGIVARAKHGTPKEIFPSAQAQEAAFIARLKTRIQQDIDMVLKDTCSIDDIPETEEDSRPVQSPASSIATDSSGHDGFVRGEPLSRIPAKNSFERLTKNLAQRAFSLTSRRSSRRLKSGGDERPGSSGSVETASVLSTRRSSWRSFGRKHSEDERPSTRPSTRDSSSLAPAPSIKPAQRRFFLLSRKDACESTVSTLVPEPPSTPERPKASDREFSGVSSIDFMTGGLGATETNMVPTELFGSQCASERPLMTSRGVDSSDASDSARVNPEDGTSHKYSAGDPTSSSRREKRDLADSSGTQSQWGVNRSSSSRTKMDTPQIFEDTAEFSFDLASPGHAKYDTPRSFNAIKSPGADEYSTAPSTPALSLGGDSSPRHSLLITPTYLRTLSGTRDPILRDFEPEFEPEEPASHSMPELVTEIRNVAVYKGEGKETAPDVCMFGPTSSSSSSSSPETAATPVREPEPLISKNNGPEGIFPESGDQHDEGPAEREASAAAAPDAGRKPEPSLSDNKISVSEPEPENELSVNDDSINESKEFGAEGATAGPGDSSLTTPDMEGGEVRSSSGTSDNQQSPQIPSSENVSVPDDNETALSEARISSTDEVGRFVGAADASPSEAAVAGAETGILPEAGESKDDDPATHVPEIATESRDKREDGEVHQETGPSLANSDSFERSPPVQSPEISISSPDEDEETKGLEFEPLDSARDEVKSPDFLPGIPTEADVGPAGELPLDQDSARTDKHVPEVSAGGDGSGCAPSYAEAAAEHVHKEPTYAEVVTEGLHDEPVVQDTDVDAPEASPESEVLAHEIPDGHNRAPTFAAVAAEGLPEDPAARVIDLTETNIPEAPVKGESQQEKPTARGPEHHPTYAEVAAEALHQEADAEESEDADVHALEIASEVSPEEVHEEPTNSDVAAVPIPEEPVTQETADAKADPPEAVDKEQRREHLEGHDGPDTVTGPTYAKVAAESIPEDRKIDLTEPVKPETSAPSQDEEEAAHLSGPDQEVKDASSPPRIPKDLSSSDAVFEHLPEGNASHEPDANGPVVLPEETGPKGITIIDLVCQDTGANGSDVSRLITDHGASASVIPGEDVDLADKNAFPTQVPGNLDDSQDGGGGKSTVNYDNTSEGPKYLMQDNPVGGNIAADYVCKDAGLDESMLPQIIKDQNVRSAVVNGEDAGQILIGHDIEYHDIGFQGLNWPGQKYPPARTDSPITPIDDEPPPKMPRGDYPYPDVGFQGLAITTPERRRSSCAALDFVCRDTGLDESMLPEILSDRNACESVTRGEEINWNLPHWNDSLSSIPEQEDETSILSDQLTESPGHMDEQQVSAEMQKGTEANKNVAGSISLADFKDDEEPPRLSPGIEIGQGREDKRDGQTSSGAGEGEGLPPDETYASDIPSNMSETGSEVRNLDDLDDAGDLSGFRTPQISPEIWSDHNMRDIQEEPLDKAESSKGNAGQEEEHPTEPAGPCGFRTPQISPEIWTDDEIETGPEVGLGSSEEVDISPTHEVAETQSVELTPEAAEQVTGQANVVVAVREIHGVSDQDDGVQNDILSEETSDRASEVMGTQPPKNTEALTSGDDIEVDYCYTDEKPAVAPEVSVRDYAPPTPEESEPSTEKTLPKLTTNLLDKFNSLFLTPSTPSSAASSVPGLPEYHQPFGRSSVDTFRSSTDESVYNTPLTPARPQTAGYLGLHDNTLTKLDVGLRGALGDSHGRCHPFGHHQHHQEPLFRHHHHDHQRPSTSSGVPSVADGGHIAKRRRDKIHEIFHRGENEQPQQQQQPRMEDGYHPHKDGEPSVIPRMMMLLAGAMALGKVLKTADA